MGCEQAQPCANGVAANRFQMNSGFADAGLQTPYNLGSAAQLVNKEYNVIGMNRENGLDVASLFTVGYGANDVDQFVELLNQFCFNYLVDVRSKPYSKYKPEYSQAPLERRIQATNIRYVFMGDLLGGLPEDRSCYTDAGKVDYEKVRSKPFHKAGIERLRRAWEQRLRVALMCGCGKPERCHRSKLIGVSLQREGIPIVHLDDHGRRFDQETVMMKLNGSPDLFGFVKEEATSRKSYDVG